MEDIDDLIKAEINPIVSPDQQFGSSAANITYSKPSPKGRGRAKVAKFQSDEE